MAYVIARGSGRFEIRETVRTARGARSRTLATFGELTPEVIARVQERSGGEIDADRLRRDARRAGAAVAQPAADAAAGVLYRELSRGAPLRPSFARLVASKLPDAAGPTEAERAAGEWLGHTMDARGIALRDLLDLADRLPAKRRSRVLTFPRLITPS